MRHLGIWRSSAALICTALALSLACGHVRAAGGNGATKFGTSNLEVPAHENLQTPSKPTIVIVEPSAKEVAAIAKSEAASTAFLRLQPDAWVAIFTLILTLATIFMYCATRAAASAATRAAIAAERTLVELERPFLFVEYRDSGFKLINNTIPLDDGGLELEFSIKYSGFIRIEFTNYGRSPAKITEIIEKYLFIDSPDAMPNAIDPKTESGTRLPSGIVSASNCPYKIVKSAYFAFGCHIIDNETLAKGRFFCMGYIRYSDLLGKNYILGWCGVFDPMIEQFIPVGNESFNYLICE